MRHGLDHTGAHPHRTHRRSVRSAALLLALAALALGACRTPARPPTTTSPTSPTTAPPGPGGSGRYVDKVFTDIAQIASGVTYKPAEPSAGWPGALKLDAWAPANDTTTKRPAIVWGFPGAFVGGSRQGMNTYAQDSARRGYVGITIDYRLLPQPAGDINRGIIPAYIDTIAAGEWLRANAARYGIDPDAITVGGASAGAMNAINAITLPGAPLPALPAGWIPAGTVNPSTTPYKAAISNSGAGAGPMGGTTSSRANQGPIIMFAGTADTIVSYSNWQKPTCDQHKAKGNVCDFVSYQGGTHVLPAQQTDLLARSAAFVHRYVLVPRGY
jgi:acetyl esterase/lipase